MTNEYKLYIINHPPASSQDEAVRRGGDYHIYQRKGYNKRLNSYGVPVANVQYGYLYRYCTSSVRVRTGTEYSVLLQVRTVQMYKNLFPWRYITVKLLP